MIDEAILREIKNKFWESKAKVRVGGRYHYYKNPDKYYTVLGIALLHGESLSLAEVEPFVIFRSDSPELNGIVWARPLADFIARVETSGKMSYRFVPS